MKIFLFISYQLSAISCQLSAIGYLFLVIGNWRLQLKINRN